MGSAFAPGGGGRGVIPRVMDTIFSRIESATDTITTVRAGFVEIHTVCPFLSVITFVPLGTLDMSISTANYSLPFEGGDPQEPSSWSK